MFGEAEEYEAILDRSHLVYFDPLPIEIHKDVGQWFWGQEIYDWIGGRLDLVKACLPAPIFGHGNGCVQGATGKN